MKIVYYHETLILSTKLITKEWLPLTKSKRNKSWKVIKGGNYRFFNDFLISFIFTDEQFYNLLIKCFSAKNIAFMN